jgi:tetratricopeptide (TPR) repeat protein
MRFYRVCQKLIILAILATMMSCSCKSFNSEVLYQYAERLHDEGKFDKAIVIYKKIIEHDPKNAIVHYSLGTAYANLRDIKNAQEQKSALVQLGRDDLAVELDKVITRAKYSKP